MPPRRGEEPLKPGRVRLSGVWSHGERRQQRRKEHPGRRAGGQGRGSAPGNGLLREKSVRLAHPQKGYREAVRRPTKQDGGSVSATGNPRPSGWGGCQVRLESYPSLLLITFLYCLLSLR